MAKKSEEKILTIEQLPGIGEQKAKKLREAGFNSVEAIAIATVQELMEAGLGEESALKAIIAARKLLNIGIVSAKELYEKRKTIAKLTTGSQALDNLLGGGVETQAITEAYGRFGSGKTQLGFQLAINVQLPKEQGGLEGGCLYVDTEGTFRPERIVQICENRGLDPEEILSKIFVVRAYNVDHQIYIVEHEVPKIIEEKKEEGIPIKLIVVDSLTARFRSDFVGRGQLSDRQQKLNRHLHYLQKWADLYDLAVYVTNQVMENPGVMFADPTRPVGGHVLAHQSTYRLYLRRAKDNVRIARLVDSPSLPEAECVFVVDEKGVHD